MVKARSLKYADVKVGMSGSFKRTISQADVKAFAKLSGDFNPLHLDKKFAGKTAFKDPIVHGMLTASLFSAAIGMRCPGRNAVILSQEIKYLKPVRPDSKVQVHYEVMDKSNSIKVITVKTSVYGSNGTLLAEGINKIRMTR